MSLLARSLPKVSREFALELKAMFPPITLGAGIDRDKLMISVGEQRVIQKVLQVSSNRIVSSKEEDIKPEIIEDTDNTVLQDKLDNVPAGSYIMLTQEEHEQIIGKRNPWWKNFTTRSAI